MRKITFAFSLLTASISIAQTPFIKNLGKNPIDRINQNIECSCIDPKNQLTVGYFKSPTSDTLVFKRWDGNKWDIYNSLYSDHTQKRNSSKCVFTADTLLYVATNYRRGGKIRIGVFYLPNSNTGSQTDSMGEFKSVKGGEVYISDIKIIQKKLLVFGRFDSVYTVQKRWQPVNNIAQLYYLGQTGNWGINPKVHQMLKAYRISNLPVATNNDTTLILANDTILRFIFPEQLELIRKPASPKVSYSGVAYLGKKWLITRPNSDSILYYTGKEFIRRKLDKVLNSDLSIINTSKGALIAEDSKEISRLFLLDTTKNKLSLIYQWRQGTADFPKSSLIKSKTTVFYSFNSPILYNDTVYKNIVELNIEALKLKPIIAYLFYDINKNYKKEITEVLVDGKLLNRAIGYIITSNAGKFEDKIPTHMDGEYILLSNNSVECLKLPFTGALKTKPFRGINDTLFFPLQKIPEVKNLFVKSWGRAIARLLDTIELTIQINTKDCDTKPADATATITLDSNTKFVSSKPSFTSRIGNIFKFDVKNITGPNGNTINLNVIYSNTKYKINDYVKHNVNITTLYPEDKKDNTDSIVQKMVYSYDPNAKYSIPQGTIISDLKSIRYYIEFQNEGNDVARRVTVVDTLDTRIPVYEFQMITASHAYSVSLNNNVVTWVFDNINLPAKSFDDKGSQGYIIFDAKIISNIGVGDSIRNKAFIYFDFNEPIVTNLSIIKRIEDLPVIIESGNTLLVYPNPANSTVTIENKINTIQDVKIFNMVGKEVIDVKIAPIDKNIQSIASWPRGMYFIRTGKGKYQKFLVH